MVMGCWSPPRCSSLTTLGIVLSLLFESRFNLVSPTEFLFGTTSSPQPR